MDRCEHNYIEVERWDDKTSVYIFYKCKNCKGAKLEKRPKTEEEKLS